MSYARRSAPMGRLIVVLVLCMALISPAGQRLLTAAATSVGHLYASAVISAVDHNASGTTAPVAPTHPERSPR